MSVIDRKCIDGGFASIKIEQHGGTWSAIDLLAMANIVVPKTLKPSDYPVYIWKTIGYNRSDTLAVP